MARILNILLVVGLVFCSYSVLSVSGQCASSSNVTWCPIYSIYITKTCGSPSNQTVSLPKLGAILAAPVSAIGGLLIGLTAPLLVAFGNFLALLGQGLINFAANNTVAATTAAPAATLAFRPAYTFLGR